MREALCEEMSGLLPDGATAQSASESALEHAVSGFSQNPAVISSARPFPPKLLASRPICAPNGNICVAQRRYSFAASGNDKLMETVLSIEFGVCREHHPFDPCVQHPRDIIETIAMMILADESVEDSQAARAGDNGAFSVWITHQVAFGAIAIADTGTADLEMSWI